MSHPVSLQVLFPDLVDLSAGSLTAALRDYHPDLATAIVELAPAAPGAASGDGPPPAISGEARWGTHVAKILGFDSPMPASFVESCLRNALIPPEMKDEARRHQAHVLLYYAGTHDVPLEQIVAVAAVAGSLVHFGAMVTLNEDARAAVPSFALQPEEDGEDMLQTLRALPLPYLYAGFVKMELTDVPGLWMRTFASHRYGLPNLAYHAAGHEEGQTTFHLFAGVLGYLRDTGLSFENNETIRIDEATHLRLREPSVMEWWLDSPGTLYVLERVTE